MQINSLEAKSLLRKPYLAIFASFRMDWPASDPLETAFEG